MINGLKGAMIALVSSLLIAIIFAYFFRLPIPLAGYIGPFGDFSSYGMQVVAVLRSVFVAWIFYGLFGGFSILPASGVITGVIIGNKYSGPKNKNRVIGLWSSTISAIPVFILSILDYSFGPW